MSTRKENVFTVAEVPGAKRKSPKEYTHAIIGRWNKENHRAEIENQRAALAKLEAGNYAYIRSVAELNPGDRYVSKYGSSWVVTADDHEKKKAIIEKYPTVEVYQSAMYDQRVEGVENCSSDLVVLRWSMSINNAYKALSEFSPRFKDLKIVPTIRNGQKVTTPQAENDIAYLNERFCSGENSIPGL